MGGSDSYHFLKRTAPHIKIIPNKPDPERYNDTYNTASPCDHVYSVSTSGERILNRKIYTDSNQEMTWQLTVFALRKFFSTPYFAYLE